MLPVSFSDIDAVLSEVAVYFVSEDGELEGAAQEFDRASGKALSRAIAATNYKGKKGKTLSVNSAQNERVKRVILIGYGKAEEISKELDVEKLGGQLAAALNQERVSKASIVVDRSFGPTSVDTFASLLAHGIQLRTYRFDKYFTKQKEEDKPTLKEVTIHLTGHEKAKKQHVRFKAVAEGVYLTRDIVTEPPNVINPVTYAERCRELKEFGVKVEVLGVKEMKKLGMGALLGVGQGSAVESKLVVMQWNGAAKNKKPIAFVGKGVTFDTGGISIKPSNGMEEMKYDMAGSGAVVGLMRALAGRNAKANVVGVIGLVENMPDGNAQRPSDVVKSMSGQTIEVLNTDAEGRLVLADALWYTQSRFKPELMVDLATLTGAITVALGNQYAGLFSNNDTLADRLYKASLEVGEKLWRLPIDKEYDKQIDSKIADVQNISNAKGAGSITASKFLQRFVNDVPWAHLDIAGMAWATKPLELVPEGASAFGVRLLNRFVEAHYEG